jgi:hypothetical protein
LVKQYRGDVRVRGFTSWDQFLCMAFAQLTYRESVRDIEACLGAAREKLHDLGFRTRAMAAAPSPTPTSAATGAYTPISPKGSLRRRDGFPWT